MNNKIIWAQVVRSLGVSADGYSAKSYNMVYGHGFNYLYRFDTLNGYSVNLMLRAVSQDNGGYYTHHIINIPYILIISDIL